MKSASGPRAKERRSSARSGSTRQRGKEKAARELRAAFDRTVVVLSLDRPGQDAAHEVALQGEEDQQRKHHRDEGGRGQDLPASA